MLCSIILQVPHSFHPTEAAHRATMHKAGKLFVQDPLQKLLRLICYQSTGPLHQPGCNLPGCSLSKAHGWGVDRLSPSVLVQSVHLCLQGRFTEEPWSCRGQKSMEHNWNTVAVGWMLPQGKTAHNSEMRCEWDLWVLLETQEREMIVNQKARLSFWKGLFLLLKFMGCFGYHQDLVGPQLPQAEEIDTPPPAGGLVTGFSMMTGQLCNLLLPGQSNTAFTESFRVF